MCVRALPARGPGTHAGEAWWPRECAALETTPERGVDRAALARLYSEFRAEALQADWRAAASGAAVEALRAEFPAVKFIGV